MSLAALWGARQPAIAALAGLPSPPITGADWDRVAAGQVARVRVQEPGADRAVGIAWIERSPQAVWIAILDDTHDTLVSGLHELQLASTTPGHKVLYQRLDLPRPFADRHWILVIENNPALYAQGVWEREWTLDPRREGALVELPEDWQPAAQGAVYTPVNDGGWWLLPQGDGALVVYQVRTDVGGRIPDELVVRYAMSTLDELLQHVASRAVEIPAHYTAAHFPISGPDDQPIPSFGPGG